MHAFNDAVISGYLAHPSDILCLTAALTPMSFKQLWAEVPASSQSMGRI